VKEVRVISIGRDSNAMVPSLESTLDAEGFPIQVVKVFASRFSQYAVEHYKENYFASIVDYDLFYINSSLNRHNCC